MSKVKSSYVDGVCPDCWEDIPDNAVEGAECVNCGHVFYSTPVEPCKKCGKKKELMPDGMCNFCSPFGIF